VATGDVNRPNGLAFLPDEKKLYIIEAGVTPRVIKVYDVNDDMNSRTFITAEHRSASLRCLSAARTSASVVPDAIACSWAASHSLYSLYVNTQGALGG
jgi:hypothetical protein